jgi:trehalose-phosphatase
MKILNPNISVDDFFANLRAAPEKLLMLDYDGTLAPFVEKFDRAFPYPGIEPRLEKLLAIGSTGVVIISGRAIKDLKKLLKIRPLPELWGCHGAEKLTDRGKYQLTELPKITSEGMSWIQQWAEAVDIQDRLEIKPAGLAFHWRGLSLKKANNIRNKIESKWQDKIADYGLEIHEFDGGLEFRKAGITKAGAVKSIMAGILSPAGKVAYLGDDLTDEDAFKALGDKGLKVLVRPEKRPSEADLLLVPPDDLYFFLDRWIENS